MALTARQVIITTDLSVESESACEPARAAAGSEGKLTLLYVADFASHLPGGALTLTKGARESIWNEVCQAASAKLEQIKERRLSDVEVELKVIDAHGAAAAICEYAESQQADLIVISAHGRSGGKLHWLGSVAERVVRMAPCDVLVVRRFPPDREG